MPYLTRATLEHELIIAEQIIKTLQKRLALAEKRLVAAREMLLTATNKLKACIASKEKTE